MDARTLKLLCTALPYALLFALWGVMFVQFQFSTAVTIVSLVVVILIGGAFAEFVEEPYLQPWLDETFAAE